MMNMNRQLQIYKDSFPVGTIDAYVYWVNKIPMLTKQEEFDLANDFIENKNVEAAKKMVMSHLRFVVKIARGYLGYGLSFADLIQEGTVGLMKAVKRFKPEIGVRLVSFAVYWVKSEIHEFVLKNWRIVKVATTKAQRKLFFNIRKMSNRLGWFNESEIKDVAKELNVSENDVRVMESRLNNYDEPCNGMKSDSSDDIAYLSPEQRLSDKAIDPAVLVEHNQSEKIDYDMLFKAIDILDDRSRDVILSRWIDNKKATLHDLAEKYSISAERVRQLESQSMKKIKKYFKENENVKN